MVAKVQEGQISLGSLAKLSQVVYVGVSIECRRQHVGRALVCFLEFWEIVIEHSIAAMTWLSLFQVKSVKELSRWVGSIFESAYMLLLRVKDCEGLHILQERPELFKCGCSGPEEYISRGTSEGTDVSWYVHDVWGIWNSFLPLCVLHCFVIRVAVKGSDVL